MSKKRSHELFVGMFFGSGLVFAIFGIAGAVICVPFIVTAATVTVIKSFIRPIIVSPLLLAAFAAAYAVANNLTDYNYHLPIAMTLNTLTELH